MAGSTLGHLFRITTFGESHGPAIGAVVDGCPPGMALTEDDIQGDLDRRKPGTSRHVTQRQEADKVEILSGVFEGKTTGTPIALVIRNTDQRSQDYGDILDSFRPGHADYTYWHKYGIRDPILMYLNQFAIKAKGLTIFGTLGLVIGVFFTLITVENAFNRIWGVQNPRPFLKRMGIHLVTAILGPLLLGLSIYLSSMVLSASKGLIGPLSQGFNFMADFFPIVLSTLSFTLVYKILPYDGKWFSAMGALAFGAVGRKWRDIIEAVHDRMKGRVGDTPYFSLQFLSDEEVLAIHTSLS